MTHSNQPMHQHGMRELRLDLTQWTHDSLSYEWEEEISRSLNKKNQTASTEHKEQNTTSTEKQNKSEQNIGDDPFELSLQDPDLHDEHSQENDDPFDLSIEVPDWQGEHSIENIAHPLFEFEGGDHRDPQDWWEEIELKREKYEGYEFLDYDVYDFDDLSESKSILYLYPRDSRVGVFYKDRELLGQLDSIRLEREKLRIFINAHTFEEAKYLEMELSKNTDLKPLLANLYFVSNSVLCFESNKFISQEYPIKLFNVFRELRSGIEYIKYEKQFIRKAFEEITKCKTQYLSGEEVAYASYKISSYLYRKPIEIYSEIKKNVEFDVCYGPYSRYHPDDPHAEWIPF